MLSALRGILKRWFGDRMTTTDTTEVQTMEAGEAPAVLGATPTCSGEYAANAATRRLKRAGTSTNEAADLKRPRTAPATPIDPGLNGGNPPVGKLTAPDTDSRIGGPTDNHNHHATTRPSTTASAPAALNRALRSQPSVSTSPPASTPGSCSASGVVTAPLPQPLLQPLRQAAEEDNPDNLTATTTTSLGPDPPQQLQPQQQPQQPPVAGPGPGTIPTVENSVPQPQLLRVAHSGGGSGAAAVRHHAAGHGPQQQPLTPHHGHGHGHHTHGFSHGGGGGGDTPQVLQLQPHPHHHHDALEEQVFSPAFHLPASATVSPATSAQTSLTAPVAAAAKSQHGGGGGGEARAVVAAAAAAVAVLASDSLAAGAAGAGGDEVRSTQPHGPGCMQLRAIDLNVVEGVAVDTDDDELAAATAADAEAAAGVARSARRRASSASAPASQSEAVQQPQRKRGEEQGGVVGKAAADVSTSGGDIEAVGEELSSSSAGEEEEEGEGDEGEGVSGRERKDDDGEEEADLYECENDENAPVAAAAVAAAAAITAAAARRRPPPSPRQQQQQDAVLVASAPRSLAAAVSAVLPAAAAAAAAAAAVAVVQPSSQQQQPQQVEEDDDEDDDEGLMEFDPLLFIKQLPPLESCAPPHRQVLLPLQTRAMAQRKTLVLDLDETLVHSSLEAVDRSDFSFPVVFNGTEHQVYVRQRPYLRDFMVRVAALFEVVVFTASQRIYAERLLDILDPEQQLVRHRIYRDSCVVVEGNYLKDLSILGRDLAHTVIVDNSPQAFGFQVDNGIPIESWYDDDADTELLRLLPFLESLAGAEVADVRPRIRSQFRLRELIDRA
ncbi:hypothetical protein PLESTM_001282700 [Pleodorina starrii]|nr:hypothetical protein PLESTM_001282700 [Pleodorina starrii]